MRFLAAAMIPLFTAVFSISIELNVPELVVGESTTMMVLVRPEMERAWIEVSAGSIEDPEILLEGLKLDRGMGFFTYRAPDYPEDVFIRISVGDDSKSFKVPIFPKPPTDMPQASFTVIDFAGHVAYKEGSDERWKPVKKGLRIFEGYTVGCAQKSFVKLVGPKNVIVEVAPESVVIFERIRTDGENVVLGTRLTIGEVILKVVKKLGRMSKVTVKAGSVTAGVRGTAFSVENSDEIHVRTFDGTVWVRIPGRYVEVKEGVKFGIDKIALEFLKEFDEAANRAWEMFKEKAEGAWEMLEKYTMFEGFFEKPFKIEPLDRTLESYESMFEELKEEWEGEGR